MHWRGCSVEQPSHGVVGFDDECYAPFESEARVPASEGACGRRLTALTVNRRPHECDSDLRLPTR